MTERGKRQGLFITFEGGEGCGKSTQMRLLAERLRREGHTVVETVEPGGTRIGELIRRILLDASNQDLRPMPELLLYFASRAQNIEEVILPALEKGAIVLSDRFTDSSMAYQGYGRGLGEDAVQALDRIACRGLVPDATVLLDVDVETGLARVRERNLDRAESRMDEQAVEFHRRVRQAFLRMAAREPGRFHVIDGRPGAEAVATDVWNVLSPLISKVHV
ncbi:MAG TPA: dTMP kinase [Bryobacteraceae bacterium]|nr:dTMP kinase [Bryobacteraceae bacterium]HOL71994.1 dTMP kinase [Bryobacteraceae bacterium]HOQ45021.1 dTMP kinase [Bryobacteraceae bacterium]HPQ16050.1 dTMP kinase [Bryobacteraceae bacterium]HPU73725.1 dTMP kinase [Bryobacteraceae bacterium]